MINLFRCREHTNQASSNGWIPGGHGQLHRSAEDGGGWSADFVSRGH